MSLQMVEGNLLVQPEDVIVNAWNRNIIPWWLLLPQGVSGALKRSGGTGPFRELARHGPMPLGSAVATSVRDCAKNAIAIVRERSFKSTAFPLIASGSGGMSPAKSLALLTDAFIEDAVAIDILVVQYKKKA
jgi:O-acetyl-ADP-ribose deacetylase (regulator of RNase III)